MPQAFGAYQLHSSGPFPLTALLMPLCYWDPALHTVPDLSPSLSVSVIQAIVLALQEQPALVTQ